jgi:hypothetical protein
MDPTNQEQSEKPRSALKKLKDHAEKDIEILGTFVRLGVVVWSGLIITLNYVEIPMVKKGQTSGDITFVASVFTGALATFGLNTSKNGGGSKPSTDNSSSRKRED